MANLVSTASLLDGSMSEQSYLPLDMTLLLPVLFRNNIDMNSSPKISATAMSRI